MRNKSSLKNNRYFFVIPLMVLIFIIALIGVFYRHSEIAFWLYPGNINRNGELVKLLLSVFAGIGVFFGLFISYHKALITEESVKKQGEAIEKQSEQIELSRKSQIDERFKNGVEHLGDKKEPIILGGIAELNQIAIENKSAYAEVVFNILCSYVRSNTNIYKKNAGDINHTAIQTIIDYLFKSQTSSNYPYSNLIANLRFSNLNGIDIDGVDFTNADFSFSYMPSITNVHFENAQLPGAQFIGANIYNVNFKNANLCQTRFHTSVLEYAKMEDGVCLIDTRFIDTKLKDVSFDNCTLNQCKFIANELTNISLENAEIVSSSFLGSIFENANFLNIKFILDCDFRASYFYKVDINVDINKSKFNGFGPGSRFRFFLKERLENRLGKCADFSNLNYNIGLLNRCDIGELTSKDYDEIMAKYEMMKEIKKPG